MFKPRFVKFTNVFTEGHTGDKVSLYLLYKTKQNKKMQATNWTIIKRDITVKNVKNYTFNDSAI